MVNVAKIQAGKLDLAYPTTWAAKLDVTALLDHLLATK